MKKINIAEPYFSPEDKERINNEVDVILNTKLSMGPNVSKFEQEFRDKIGTKYAIAMNSCTSALEAALTFYNIQNKEVIIPAQTFIATGMAVHLSGGIPVYAEINENDLSLDLNDIKNKITNKTAGVIIVHMAGYISSDIFELKKYCVENNLFLIEDAAHTPGAEINNCKAGNIGDIGCFSFYPTKIITAGEGGMLTTNDKKISDYARSYQNRGRDMNLNEESFVIPSRNVRMTEFSALLGRVQLSHLDEFLKKRRLIAKTYKKYLDKSDCLQLILPEKLEQTACWKVPLILNSTFKRKEILNKLHIKGIYADTAYNPPLHLQPVMTQLYNNKENLLPRSEALLKKHICLPSHQNMSIDDAKYVCDTLLEILNKN